MPNFIRSIHSVHTVLILVIFFTLSLPILAINYYEITSDYNDRSRTAIVTDNNRSITIVSFPVTSVPALRTSTGLVSISYAVPTVSITAPANNTTFYEGGTAPISAVASDNNGQIAKVEFYANDIKIGEATSPPYAFNWTSLVIGNYSLTAKAINDKNEITTSAIVKINVIAAPPNQLPIVSITAPANNEIFTEGSSIAITASAKDNDGQVIKVEFYAGTTKIGESTTSPYSIIWPNVAKGIYALTAVAMDDNGETTTSSVVTITVNSKTIPEEPDSGFYRAINLNGKPMSIDGHTWEGADAANYTYSGISVRKTSIDLIPATDDERAFMIRSSITGNNVSIAMTAVPKGTYDVFLYVWEDATNQTFNVYLEGKAVQINYESGNAGTWKRLGPFRENITDNTINIKTSGGKANVSGIEVWVADQNASTTCAATGYILREQWNNVSSDASPLIPAYQKPDNSSQLILFEAPSNVSDNYRSRIRGYVCPPATGTYSFWISGDAEAELWLSMDENPVTKTRIAYLSEATKLREWSKSSSQRSALITLTKGKKYYIEAIHKAGEGNDHLAVGWQLPGGTQEMPIAGSRLSPYVPSAVEFASPVLAENTLHVFPNPADDIVTIQFSVNESQSAVITVTTINTQQVVNMKQSVQPGENTIPIGISHLVKGIYIVFVQTKEGRISKKLVVNR